MKRNGNGNGNGNGAPAAAAAAGRKARAPPPAGYERSGRGPGASYALLVLTLLTPVAILALGLACGDPAASSSPSAPALVARAALAARRGLGASRHRALCRAAAHAAPDLAPKVATLALWGEQGLRDLRASGLPATASAALGRLGLVAGGRGGGGEAAAAAAAVVAAPAPPAAAAAPTCQLSGTVDAECCHCTYADIQALNDAHVAPLVSAIVRTAFFRYFKVNIACDCPLWPDDGMCSLSACSVCRCGEDEVPAPWLAAEGRGQWGKGAKEQGGRKRGGSIGIKLGGGGGTGGGGGKGDGGGGKEDGGGEGGPPPPECAGGGAAAPEGCSTAGCALEASGRVDTTLDAGVASRLRHVRGWRGVDNPWIYNATEAARAARRQQRQRQSAAALSPFASLGGGGGATGADAADADAATGKKCEREAEEDAEDEEQYQYINLLANPERYTGYKGEHAHRIWAEIYGQSCFAPPGGGGSGGGGSGGGAGSGGAGSGAGLGGLGPALLKQELARCTEKRVFYRLISGMHASISAHLVGDWLLDEARGEWGPNLPEFRRRFADEPEAGERVANLYFAYSFVLRAVTKAAPLLADTAQYETGLPEEDARTRELVAALLGPPAAAGGGGGGGGVGGGGAAALLSACPLPFDEGRLWLGEEGPELRRQLQGAFQNITRVMDCVGCEKCKLWGKLQTLGVATALKILFSEEDCDGNAGAPLRLAAAPGSGGEAGGGAAAAAAAAAGWGGKAGAAAGAAAATAASDDDDDDYADGYDEEEEGKAGGAAAGGGGGGGASPDRAASAAAAAKPPPPPMTLERNEVIALVNLLGRFSNALRLYHELSARAAQEDGAAAASDAQTLLA